MNITQRLEKLERIAAKRGQLEAIRIVHILISPTREIVGAHYKGQHIERQPNESEEDFAVRYEKVMDDLDQNDDRPIVAMTDDDINL